MDRKIGYKIELIYVKYSPIVISLAILFNNVLSYFDIYIDLFNYIFGVSVVTIGHLYNSSRVYKFCKYHRMFIHYITVNTGVSLIDNYIRIPINDFMLLLLYLIIAAIFLFFILYYHQKCK